MENEQLAKLKIINSILKAYYTEIETDSEAKSLLELVKLFIEL